ncbi:MAG: nucleotidyltransferase domain-containing protein, partial [Chloroflexia bacterium]
MSKSPEARTYTPKQIADILSPLPNVRAIALAGSSAAGVADAGSDYDIYLYTDAQVPLKERKELAAQYTSYSKVGNVVWGEADEWVLKGSGQRVDLVYFGADWMADQLDRVLVRHIPSPGYSTAFWHTIRISQTLYDPQGWFAALHAQAQLPYPEPLRRNIVGMNYPILKREITSYYQQIAR